MLAKSATREPEQSQQIDSHRFACQRQAKAWLLTSTTRTAWSVKRAFSPYDRIETMPERASPKAMKIGLRVTESMRLSSRESAR